MPGAVIDARNQQHGGTESVISDERGYRLTDLSPGRYDLECSFPGMTTVVQDNVEVGSNEGATVNFDLMRANGRDDVIPGS